MPVFEPDGLPGSSYVNPAGELRRLGCVRRQAIELDPSQHVYFSNRSAAYLSKKDADSALADAEQCIKLNPSWAKGYSRKGAALHALKQYKEAEEVYEEGETAGEPYVPAFLFQLF